MYAATTPNQGAYLSGSASMGAPPLSAAGGPSGYGGGSGNGASSAARSARPRGETNAPSSSSGNGFNFCPSEFAYNVRVAFALVPALLVLALVGGPLTAAVLTVGALAAYAADALALREGALLAGLGSLALATLSLSYRVLAGPTGAYAAAAHASSSSAHAHAAAAAATQAVALAWLVTAACASAAFLCGCWLTLQFRAVQLAHPALVVALERLVLGASVPVGAAVGAMGTTALLAGDLAAVPYVLLLLLVALYHLLSRPLVSSFHVSRGRAVGPAGGWWGAEQGGGAAAAAAARAAAARSAARTDDQEGGAGTRNKKDDDDDDSQSIPWYATSGASPFFWVADDAPLAAIAQRPLDSALSAACVAWLPSAVYLALHGPALLSADPLLHLWSVLLLLGAGTTYLSLALNAMWWLPGPRFLAGLLRLAGAVVGAALLVVGFEGRVVFRGFASYIPLPAPYSYLAVAVALGGVAALGIAHAYGAIGFGDLGGDGTSLLPLDSSFAAGCLMAAAAAASLAAGVPPAWLPAPLAAAAGLSLTYATAGLREYCVFVGGAAATMAWFVQHHFGFLFEEGGESGRGGGGGGIGGWFGGWRGWGKSGGGSGNDWWYSASSSGGGFGSATSGGITLAGMPLRDLTRLALAAAVPALLLPGAALAAGFGGAGVVAAATSAAPRSLAGALLVAQAALVAVCEERMRAAPRTFAGGGGDSGDSSGLSASSAGAAAVVYDEAAYPPWLVAATTAAGLLAAMRLRSVGLVPRWAAWAAGCVHAAKMAALVVPENGMVLPVAALLLATASPLFLHRAPADGGGLQQGGGQGQRMRNVSVAYRHGPQQGGAGAPRNNPRERDFARGVRLSPLAGFLHAAAALIALAGARFALFDAAVWAAEGGRPTEATLLGALLVAAALALAPLVLRCYAHRPALRRLAASLAVSGLLIAWLQPPLPSGGALFGFGSRCPRLPFAMCWRLFDERHVPARSQDDAAVWSAALLTGEGGGGHAWHRWLLVLAAALASAGLSLAPAGGGAGVSAAGGAVAASSSSSFGGAMAAAAAAALRGGEGDRRKALSSLLRLAAGLACGALVGDYLAIELVPAQPVLQVLMVSAALMLLAAVVLTQSAAAAAAAGHGGSGGGGGGKSSVGGAQRASLPPLPALLIAGWAAASLAALALQPLLPLPDIHRFRRLFPDAGVGASIQQERRSAARASLVAAFGGQALVLALALKLSARRVLGPIDADPDEADDYVGAVRAAAAAGGGGGGVGGGSSSAAAAAAASGAGDAFHRELSLSRSRGSLGPGGGAGGVLSGSRTSSAASLLLGSAESLMDRLGLLHHGGGGGGGAGVGVGGGGDAGEETPAARAARRRRLRSAGLSWAPLAGNAAACLALLAALDLNFYVTAGQPEPVFVAAPALLLLQRDGGLLRRLAPQRRYCPPFALIAAYLALRSAAEALGWAYGYDAGLASLLKHAPGALAAVPSQLLWLRHLWRLPARPSPPGVVAACAALSVVSLCVSPYESVAYLAASGLIFCGLVVLRGRRWRSLAMKRL